MTENVPHLDLYKYSPIFFLEELKFLYPSRSKQKRKFRPPLDEVDDFSKHLLLNTKSYMSGTINAMKSTQTSSHPSKTTNLCLLASESSNRCEKCLALHSIFFGVRVYSFSTIEGIITLFAFQSHHTHTIVMDSCSGRNCRSLEPLACRLR